MRALVELVDNLTGTVRFIVCGIIGFGIVVSIVLTVGMSFVAPKVAADYGDRAERIGEAAIAAAQEEARNRELAKDGWGYGEPARVDQGGADATGDTVGGWGADTD